MIDDAPAIMESMRAGQRLPAGIFVCLTPLEYVGVLRGICSTDQSRNHNAWKDRQVTVIVDGRTDQTEPLLRIRRPRALVSDIGFVGCVVKNYQTDKGKGTLIEVVQPPNAWPVGNITFERVTLANSEIGWYFAPGNHADHIAQHECITHQVNTPYCVNENQSVDHNIDMQCKGDGKTIVDVRDGGRLTGKIRTTGRWDCLLSVGDPIQKTGPTKNQGFYDLDVLFDAADKFGTLYRERYAYEWARACVNIRGYMAVSCEITNPPVLLNKSRVRINVDNQYKPYVFEAN